MKPLGLSLEFPARAGRIRTLVNYPPAPGLPALPARPRPPAPPARARHWGWRVALISLLALCALAAGYSLGSAFSPSSQTRLSPTERAPRSVLSVPGPVHTDVVFRAYPRTPLLALTFDDGPDPRWTEEVLAMLQKHGAKATFFEIGAFAQQYPRITAKLQAAGMEIGLHEWEHQDLRSTPEKEVAGRLDAGLEVLTQAASVRPSLFRPPYGRLDTPVLQWAARQNLRCVLWSDHITDTRARYHVERLAANLSPGLIILAHDGRSQAGRPLFEAIDWFIEQASAQGYRFVTVSELLAAQD